jgi:hypothetical protein
MLQKSKLRNVHQISIPVYVEILDIRTYFPIKTLAVPLRTETHCSDPTDYEENL